MIEQINRWNHLASFEHSFDCDASMHASAEGQYVTYADHVEALRQRQRDAIITAVQRVEALEVSLIDVRFNLDDPHDHRQAVLLSQCIAAIKGDQL